MILVIGPGGGAEHPPRLDLVSMPEVTLIRLGIASSSLVPARMYQIHGKEFPGGAVIG